MTTEPKFIPEKAVEVELSGGGSFRARLVDCVGYMVDGALGHEENNAPRLVKSPWFDNAVPFDLAAETGTRKVIREHATVGLVVTTDGTIDESPRDLYLDAEQRIIAELDDIGKPYLILLNCVDPDSEASRSLAAGLERDYGRPVIPVSCTQLTAEKLDAILKQLLYEFPVQEIAVNMPAWVTMLEPGHWLQSSVYGAAAVCRGHPAHAGRGRADAGHRLRVPDRRQPLRHGPGHRQRAHHAAHRAGYLL